ncbi:MAG: manganese efflux pump, partial [Thermoplasmata archaeon]|nr:manganese efflux pump [Thermoplasmata archaeon]
MTAIGLAMDCLAVSISCGITMNEFNRRDAIVLAIFFGGFQGGMALLGWLGGMGFAEQIESIDHWIAFGLLTIIGGKMIKEGMEQKSQCETFNIRKIRVLVILSIATSIDALAIGITYAFLQTPIFIPVLLIGIMSFVF